MTPAEIREKAGSVFLGRTFYEGREPRRDELLADWILRWLPVVEAACAQADERARHDAAMYGKSAFLGVDRLGYERCATITETAVRAARAQEKQG